jgi:2-iminobutanoate/2-iminopropanoate deaminase
MEFMMADVVRVKSGSKFEDSNSFCRVVRAGNFIFSSNSSGRDYVTGVMSPDPAEQMLQAIKNIEHGLSAVGASISDTVRVQISLTNLKFQDSLLKAFAARFLGIDPTLTIICQPFVGDVKVEVEITAFHNASGGTSETIRVKPRGGESF